MIEDLCVTHENDRGEKDSSHRRGKLEEIERYEVCSDGHPHVRMKGSKKSNAEVGECKSSDEIKSIEPGNTNYSKTQPTTAGSKESLENFCNILKAINTTSSTTSSSVHLLQDANADKSNTKKKVIYSRLGNTNQKRPIQCCHFQRMLFRVTRTKDQRTFFLPAILKWEQSSNDLPCNCHPCRRIIREHSKREVVFLSSRRGGNSNNSNCCCTNTKTSRGPETLTGYLVLCDSKNGYDCKGSKGKSSSPKCTCDVCSCCCCCQSDDGSVCCTCQCGECCRKPKRKAKRKSKSDCCDCCVPKCACCMPMCCCMCPCMCGKNGQSGENSEKSRHQTCTILRNGDSDKTKLCEEFKIIRPIPSSFLNTCYIIDDCKCSKDEKPDKASKPVQTTKTTKGTTTKTSTKGGAAKAGAKKGGAKKGAPAKKGGAKKAPPKRGMRNMRSLF